MRLFFTFFSLTALILHFSLFANANTELSGGDTTVDKTLTEDDLFKLELDAFMRLIETQKTQDRIKHTLATGKPLVN